MKYVSMRIPEPSPWGETFFDARVRATVAAGRLNPPVTLVLEGQARAGAEEADADGAAGPGHFRNRRRLGGCERQIESREERRRRPPERR